MPEVEGASVKIGRNHILPGQSLELLSCFCLPNCTRIPRQFGDGEC